MWIRTTAFGMQASFWYYLAWALPRALKAALLSMSSTPLNFGYPGDSLIFRRKIAFLFFLRGSVSTAPKCSIAFEALLAAVLSVLPGGGVSRDHEYMWLSESGVSPAHIGLA